MAENHVAAAFARRKSERVQRAWRYYRRMLILGAGILAVTVAPMALGWRDAIWPAAIGTAILAFIMIHCVGTLPMQYRAYVWPYFDCAPERIAQPGERFGRALFRFSGVLDDWAREAGLPLFTRFESPDVIDTGRPPQWHAAQLMLRTVDQLVARARVGSPLHADLQELQAMLHAAAGMGARGYLLVATLGDGTNAMVEAMRRGERV